MIYCCFASAKDSSRLNGQVKRRLKPVKHAKITKVAKVYLFVLNSIKTRLIWSSKPISSCFSGRFIRRQATDKGKNSSNRRGSLAFNFVMQLDFLDIQYAFIWVSLAINSIDRIVHTHSLHNKSQSLARGATREPGTAQVPRAISQQKD